MSWALSLVRDFPITEISNAYFNNFLIVIPYKTQSNKFHLVSNYCLLNVG